jgi:hypothetical protein
MEKVIMAAIEAGRKPADTDYFSLMMLSHVLFVSCLQRKNYAHTVH